MLSEKLNRKRQDYISNWVSKSKRIVLKHIDTDNYAVFLFGSRASNLYSHSSDLDIGVLGNKPLDRKVISSIKQELEDSDIPFSVDIIDFYDVDDNFKRIALKKIDLWNKPKFININ